MKLNWKEIDPIIDAALKEDMPEGDITSESVIPEDLTSRAVMLAKQGGVLAGMPIAERIFHKIDAKTAMTFLVDEGKPFAEGTHLAEVEGNSISLLKGERTALNFLQRLSGIASTTRMFVDALSDTESQILDTRKTTPGLRILEKYAVQMGGGKNHRFSLSDMVLLKDNHLHIVGSITKAVRQARERVRSGIKIEVETTSMAEVKEAFQAGADMIMLDNMTIPDMECVIEWVDGRVPLEVSGNIDMERIRELAGLGADYFSVGGLTHSAKALDISMDFLS